MGHEGGHNKPYEARHGRIIRTCAFDEAKDISLRTKALTSPEDS